MNLSQGSDYHGNGKFYSKAKISTKNMKAIWAIINKKGNHNGEHMHSYAWLSGVYYPKVPSDLKDGSICFTDPNIIRRFERDYDRFTPRPSYCLTPKTGTLFIFPAWLNHAVKSHDSDEDRIAISFNIWDYSVKKND